MNQNRNDLPIHRSLIQAARLLEEASSLLRRASEAADESVPSAAIWTADVARDRIATLAGDLRDGADGHMPPVRVEMVAIGRPEGADSGGGFGHRALQALALCREAWGNADHKNAPRLEHAMGWIARAWLETKGYEYAGTVRAVLGNGFDNKDRIVAAVNAAAAQQTAGIARTLVPLAGSHKAGGK